MPLANLSSKYIEINTSAEKIKFTDINLSEDFKMQFAEYITNNLANGYTSVNWEKYSTRIITSSGKSIYLTNYWFYLAFELARYLDALFEHQTLFKKIFAGEDLNTIAKDLRVNISVEHAKKIRQYINTNDYTQDDYKNFESFVSDYSGWGGGKTIDREDYYVSPLMKAGNLLAETQSAIAEIAKIFYQTPELRKSFEPMFVLANSVDKDLKKKNILFSDNSRSLFVYNLIKYLLNNNLQRALFDYLIIKDKKHGSYNLEYNKYRLTSLFKVSDLKLKSAELFRGHKLRFFEKPFDYKSKYYYLSNQWTDGTSSRLDIQSLTPIFNSLYSDYQIISDGDSYSLKKINNVEAISLPKPFILLAGISGTGKTRFVREQAKAYDNEGNNYCLVPVRPDWHEPSDLLGYISRLSDKPEYVSTKTLHFIIQAWKAIAPFADENGHGELDLSVPPYWLCLDEMNLAPVEQYFADYLSVLESRKIENKIYSSEALLDKSQLHDLSQQGANLQKDLGLIDDDSLWAYFLCHGISIPPNLIVAGTVNMDETTHGFSRKVIDRALTIDFGEFYNNNFDHFFNSPVKPKVFSYSLIIQATINNLDSSFDTDGAKSIRFLAEVNNILKRTPFELAYRALNELLLQVICSNPKNEGELQAVWDDFLMMKILPRIDGDEDKLRSNSGDSETNILDELIALLKEQLSIIWESGRRDFFRVKNNGEIINDIPCRTKDKLDWMKGRLEKNTFTSFWP